MPFSDEPSFQECAQEADQEQVQEDASAEFGEICRYAEPQKIHQGSDENKISSYSTLTESPSASRMTRCDAVAAELLNKKRILYFALRSSCDFFCASQGKSNLNSNSQNDLLDDLDRERDDELNRLQMEAISSIKKLTADIVGFSSSTNNNNNDDGFKSDLERYRKCYTPIYQNQTFSCGVFSLAKGHSLPFHDHPDMTVFTHVLRGRVKVTSIDILHRISSQDLRNDGISADCEYIIGRVSDERELDENDGNVHITEAIHRNIHCLTALEDSAFLDSMGPPYDADERKCTIFELILFDKANDDICTLIYKKYPEFFADDRVCFLRSTDRQCDVERVPYRGVTLAQQQQQQN